MKYVIASDIHGSRYYLKLLLEFFESQKADKLILLGDLLYHGARNPLPRDYDTVGCTKLLNAYKKRLFCVRGNCDSEVDSLVLEFPITAEYAILPMNGRIAYLTHGHKNPENLGDGEILFNGHFHVPAFEQRGNILYVNCGSVSIPKENSPHSCILTDGKTLLFYDLETGKSFRKERF